MRYIIEEVKDCSDCPYMEKPTTCMHNDNPRCDIPNYPEIPDSCPLPKKKGA
jgi:hypothetical protein